MMCESRTIMHYNSDTSVQEIKFYISKRFRVQIRNIYQGAGLETTQFNPSENKLTGDELKHVALESF